MSSDNLVNSKYLSLGTWRKNGTVVDTPVWFAREADYLYIFSAGDAGKVKRLRNSSRARVAPCTYSGKITGDWLPATAETIADATECEQAYQALRRRYGWQLGLLDVFSTLGGKKSRRAFIRITLAP